MDKLSYLNNHKKRSSTQMIPEFVVPKTCTHSPYNFGVSFFMLLRSLECEAGLLILQGRHKFESMAVGYWLNFI